MQTRSEPQRPQYRFEAGLPAPHLKHRPDGARDRPTPHDRQRSEPGSTGIPQLLQVINAGNKAGVCGGGAASDPGGGEPTIDRVRAFDQTMAPPAALVNSGAFLNSGLFLDSGACSNGACSTGARAPAESSSAGGEGGAVSQE
ncbi:MAG: hypothetical protein LC772_03960, partial [Chloroflexi bacterium]|nr:hypothetical protein [Chloroflexota bacterium]